MASREGSESLDGLVTESRRAKADYSNRSTRALVELMNAEDATVPEVVGSAAAAIADAIDAVVERLERGGRLVYVGAGSSGRMGALDATSARPPSPPPPASGGARRRRASRLLARA
jgi:N-acetylmuramic acid 6-phosphate etherase